MQAVRSKKYEAFPGDRYIANLEIAAKASKPWVRVLWVAVAVSAIADFYIMWSLLAQLLKTYGPENMLGSTFDINGMPAAVGVLFMTFALVISYLLIGRLVGKKAAEYKAFRSSSSLVIAVLLFVADLLALAMVTILRFFGEYNKVLEKMVADGRLENADFEGSVLEALAAFSSGGIAEFFGSLGPATVTALINALILLTIMALGAALSMIASYYGSDPVAGEKLRDAKSHLHGDSQTYAKSYFHYGANPEKDRKYEEQERQLDQEIIAAVFELSSLASQLNGVLDPADAQEFRQASSIVSREWFRASSQEA